MDWEPGYREWVPPPELGDSVACLWTRVVPPGGGQITLVLPDACCDLIWQGGLLVPTLAPAAALRLLAGRVGELVRDSPADPLVTEAARLLGRPRAQAGDVAARLDVGERQLLRRCRATVGYGPATLRRVLRFRRFVTMVDTGGGGPAGLDRAGPDLAGLAADTGYADQAHLTRECVRLAGLPPAALAAQRRSAA
jgi:AraC-like DNA-binding protein